MVNKKNNSELRRGFTLLETLVAISIVTLTIVGPLAMASQASRLADAAKNQLTANYLAQEAMEFIRNRIATNMIKENAVDPATSDRVDWLRGEYTVDLDGNPLYDIDAEGSVVRCCGDSSPEICYIDTVDSTIYSCGETTLGCGDGDALHRVDMVFTLDGYRHDPFFAIPIADRKKTTFRRFVQIDLFKTHAPSMEDGDGIKVRVTVEWVDTYGKKKLVIQENMYKYR